MSFSRVSEIMSDVIQINENDPISHALALFESRKISGAPVSDNDGIFVGVLSKTDIASQRFPDLLMQKGLDNVYVKDLMNAQKPISVKADSPLDDAIDLMDTHQIHRVFVCDSSDRIVGIVTTLDVVSSLRYAFESYI